MTERRQQPRDKVMFGAVAAVNEQGSTRDCVVRNISDQGARIEFGSTTGLPDTIRLRIAKKDRSFLARIVWLRDNAAGVAFAPEGQTGDLEERLRRSERKKRELQRRLNVLMGLG